MHPDASFVDLCYGDFVNAAGVASPVLAQSDKRGVGQTILDAVRATGETTGSNANLGIILLLAPLAAVGRMAKAGLNGVEILACCSEITPEKIVLTRDRVTCCLEV